MRDFMVWWRSPWRRIYIRDVLLPTKYVMTWIYFRRIDHSRIWVIKRSALVDGKDPCGRLCIRTGSSQAWFTYRNSLHSSLEDDVGDNEATGLEIYGGALFFSFPSREILRALALQATCCNFPVSHVCFAYVPLQKSIRPATAKEGIQSPPPKIFLVTVLDVQVPFEP